MSKAVFSRLNQRDDDRDDHVQVIVSRTEDGIVADVIWPSNASTDGGTYLYATYVPVALERAEDVRQNYGFAAVVVIIDDPALWDPAWGTLV